MDLSKVLEQLRRELVHLDAAILSLERLQAKAGRRGQPRRVPVEILKAHAKTAAHGAPSGPQGSRKRVGGRPDPGDVQGAGWLAREYCAGHWRPWWQRSSRP